MKKILLLSVLMLSLMTVELFSAGTPAGTVIESRSRVIFTSRSGTVPDTAYSLFVSITVAQKAAWNITPAVNAATTVGDSLFMVYAFSVTNSGNGIDGVSLSASSSKRFGIQFYRDGNGDGVLQNGERSIGAITQVRDVAVDAQIPLIVRIQVPRGENLNGSKDTTTLITRSIFDTTSVNTGSVMTTVQTAVLDVSNPGLTVDNAVPTAGEQIIFSFTLTNAGSLPANNVSLYDLLSSRFTLVSGSTTLGVFNSSTNPVLWTIGTLAPSQSVTVTLTLQVNAAVATGTVINNSLGINYSVGGNVYTVGSNTVPVTVSGTREYGVELTQISSPQTKDAADSVWYRYKVRNTGSFKDLIELTAVSNQNLPWKLYRDGNSNGIWDVTDPLLTNTNDSAGVDIDSVAMGDSVRVFAMTATPMFDVGLEYDSLTITAVSTGDRTKRDDRSVVTTIRSPVVQLSKSILPAGNQPAGSIITYRISYANTGAVAVSAFSVIDTAPRETYYVQNTVKVNDISVSDNSGGVSITSDESNNTVIAVSIGTLSAGSTGTVEFKVKIK